MKKTTIYSLLLILIIFSSKKTTAQIIPGNLRCELLQNPLGIDVTNPRLSWKLTGESKKEFQTAYRVIVASSESLLKSDKGDVWDSKIIYSNQSINLKYQGVPLATGKKYYWKVKAWDKDKKESEWSKPAFWSMGILKESNWNAKWIGLNKLQGNDDTTSDFRKLSARYLRKEFKLDNEIENASVSICGLGLYELSINGKKVGNEVLSPAQTQFNKRVLYNTYDITNYINKGNNAIGVILGNGRYFAMRKMNPSNMVTFGFPKLLMQIDIVYKDGTKKQIISDESWKIFTNGPITENSEYDGERYDARKEITGWNNIGFDDKNWMSVEVLTKPSEKVSAQMNEPIRITQTIKPVSVKEIKNGIFIYDMGQNLVGWVHLKVKGVKGQTIKLRFAESLKGDSLYLDNVRGAKVTDVYICKGEGIEEWEPRFTYHGFRYVEITGLTDKPDLTTIEGKFVHDDLTKLGEFSSSNEMINAIYKNAVWGINGNYRSFPTDCPQRDERMGWLGDRAIGSRGESFVNNIESLYQKWLQDVTDAQLDSGAISDVCPAYWSLYNDNVTWEGTPIILLDMLNVQYSDSEAVKKFYPGFKKWYDYMSNKYLKNGIISRDSYGDWCVPPDEPETILTSDPDKITDGTYIATSYFYYLSNIMKHFSEMIDKREDVTYFTNQAEIIKTAFNKKFFNDKTITYSNNTSTASILALAFNMVDEKNRSIIADNLIEKIETQCSGHIPVGLIGAQFLMRTLTQIGRADIALRFATQTDYPSWGYMIKNDATTIWELWNGNTADPAMNSQNHVMLLGDLLTWFYENLAGIKTDEKETGFKHIIMEPTLISGLNFINASYKSPYGLIVSKWRLNEKIFSWDITIPVNSSATIYIPAKSIDNVFENNVSITKLNDLKVVGVKDGKVIIEALSGTYKLSSNSFNVITSPKVVSSPTIEKKIPLSFRPVIIKSKCNTEGATIRYTTDGKTPTENSEIYKGGIEIKRSTTLALKAFKEGYNSSYENRFFYEIYDKVIPIKDITYLTKYSSKYTPANGEKALIDFELGSRTYSDKRWIGYEATDMEVILDMGETKEINTVNLRFLSSTGAWIFLPEAINISASEDLNNFKQVENKNYGIPIDTSSIVKYSIPLNKLKARYLKVKVKNYGKCPEWHSAKGNDAWIFTDEIFVD